MKHAFILKYALYAQRYADIQHDLNIDKATFYKMTKEFEEEINVARKVRQICIRKGVHVDKHEAFYEWYKTAERVCHYCKCTEKDIELYFNTIVAINKRPTRGKTLEIERIDSSINDYSIIENLTFACYICNNAKSDFFTEEKFKPIGEEIGRTILNSIQNINNG